MSSLISKIAVLVLMGGDVAVDGAHHLPGAGHLHVARVLACWQPPPGLRRAGDHDPAVALLLRTFLHTDVHQFEVLPLRLEPEVDGVLLLRLVLVVKDNVREPAIAVHAAHVLDLVEDEMEVGVELRIAEHEGAVLGALVDHLLHRGVDVVLGEVLGGPCSARGGCGRGDRGRSGGGVVLGRRYRRRWSHRWQISRGLVGGPQRRRNSKAQRRGNRRGACDRDKASIKTIVHHWSKFPCHPGR